MYEKEGRIKSVPVAVHTIGLQRKGYRLGTDGTKGVLQLPAPIEMILWQDSVEKNKYEYCFCDVLISCSSVSLCAVNFISTFRPQSSESGFFKSIRSVCDSRV
jgi:hypothetical protein